MDQLVKATAEGVRVYAAVTTDLVNEGIRRHGCKALAGAALGRTMTGALLLAANLKNKEALTVKVQGNGPLGNITADATPEGAVRGYIRNPQVELPLTDGKLSVGQGVGAGIISVTRFTNLKDPQTGSCEIFSGEIAEDLTRYMLLSEQTPSSIGLGVLIEPDETTSAAGGFIIQPLPEASDEIINRLEQNLQKIRPVSAMIKDGLDGKGIIAELLQGFEVNYLTITDLAFKCNCSKRHTEDILLTLCKEDLAQLVEDGQAEVCCHFCGEKYHFIKDELVAIYNVSQELKRRKALQKQ